MLLTASRAGKHDNAHIGSAVGHFRPRCALWKQYERSKHRRWRMFAGKIGLPELGILLVIAAVLVVPYWQIFKKAGFSPFPLWVKSPRTACPASETTARRIGGASAAYGVARTEDCFFDLTRRVGPKARLRI